MPYKDSSKIEKSCKFCKDLFLAKPKTLANKEQVFCSKECRSSLSIKHGFNIRSEQYSNKRKFYDRWRNMKTRCYNPNRKEWKNYGGRGIIVSSRWLNFNKFIEDMYDSFIVHLSVHGPKDTTLDRINVNKSYSKNNCKWSTKKEQLLSRRNNRYIIYKGSTYSIKKLAEIFNKSYGTIQSRLDRGISLDKPYRKSRSPKTNNSRIR